jgi:hypothetical protein
LDTYYCFNGSSVPFVVHFIASNTLEATVLVGVHIYPHS